MYLLRMSCLEKLFTYYIFEKEFFCFVCSFAPCYAHTTQALITKAGNRCTRV